ncbi:MAG TPA: hypothetical protein VKA19_14060 [Alphaproteobacteria bacterium]|nr:hypothetical protein [Alphaproteobacteria bacterium]
MILKNREGLADFDIAPDWHENRRRGLSGLVRLRDEETWCAKAIESFWPWCDELIIVVQPSRDRTRELVERYASHPGVRIYDYPYQSHPSGPGHDACPADSVYASAYHYNWTLAQSTMSHAVKLDGDMVTMDWAGSEIRARMADGHDRIKFHGTDIVGEELAHIGCHPHCPTAGVFKVTPEVHYSQGALTQRFHCGQPVTHTIDRPAFLHFKWAKPAASATKRWPKDWRRKEHFRRIYARRIPVEPYAGEYPASVRELL